jgi:tetratricopeptide (TPR) repeat protein
MSAVQILKEDLSSPAFKPLESALHAWEIRRSDPPESHRLARDLVEHALEFDDPLVTAWAYLTCGAHELAANDFDLAKETLESATRLFSRSGEKRGESLAAVLRGRMHFVQGEFHGALEVFKSVIEREGHGLAVLERFEAFNAISGCLWAIDKVELSLLYLTKALDLLKNGPYAEERATVLSNMGAALIHVGNFEDAKKFLLCAQDLANSRGNQTLRLNIGSNLVACYLELQETAAAVKASHRLIVEHQDLVFSSPSNGVLCNAAIAFAKARRWELAQQCMVGAAIIGQETPTSRNELVLAHAEAAIAEERGHYAVAIAHAESLLERFGDEVTNEIRNQSYAILVRCYQQLSRIDDVIDVKRKRLKLLDARYKDGLAAAMVVLDVSSSLHLVDTK